MRQLERTIGRRRLLLVAGGALLSACALPGAASPVASPPTIPVRRGDIETTVSASGAVAARADTSLAFGESGTIKEILVKPGERVTAGQLLASLDDRSLRLKLAEAEAALASAQAKHEATKAGATPKQIEEAEAGLRAAEAKYRQTARGTTTPQDIADAEAALRAAEARLQKAKTGTTTAQDLTEAEATLRAAEAKLEKTKTGTTTPEDIAEAEATLRSAQSALAELQAGKPEEVDAAVRTLEDARSGRLKAESQLSQTKEAARLAMEQAASEVRSAQARYGAAKLVYDEAVRTGKDPNIAEQKGQPKGARDLTDAKLRGYKADYEAAEQALRQAEAALETRRLAYEDTKKQEIAGLQEADRKILDAQAQVEKAKAGASDSERTAAHAAVEKAQAQLDKLRRPVSEADIADAEAAVDRARAGLEKLRQPPKASDIVEAEAAVDRARAALEKLQRGVPADDLAVAQASIDQAQATLTDLQAGPKAAELAQTLAAVKSSEVALAAARLKLDGAALLAPFDGIVAAVGGQPGQPVPTGSSGLLTLVDDSVLRIDIRVAESDVARLRTGQAARITVDALPERTLTGTVTFIAPKATIDQNVVSYLATIEFAGTAEAAVKVGMTASVTVVIERKQGVLVVPNRALRDSPAGRQVEVRHNGQTFSVLVQVGLAGDMVSEVVAGLKEGDEVVIPTASPAQGPGAPGGDTVLEAPAGGAGGHGGPVFFTKP